jgi:hypothetical protein
MFARDLILHILGLLTPVSGAELGRGMGKKGWIREKSALDTIQSDFLMDGYPPLENRDGSGGL